jgi:branched-chain amino acid transport system permease protein
VDVLGFLVQYLAVAGVYALLAISMNIEYGWAGIPNFGKAAFIAAGGIAAALTATRIAPVLLLHTSPADPSSLNFFRVYNTKILAAYAAHPVDTWIIFGISAVLGGLIAVALGVAFTYPAIRLKEDYLAIALLMSAQIVWVLLRYIKPIMGGTMSLKMPSPDFESIAERLAGPEPPPVVIDALRAGFIWLLVLLFLAYAERQMQSPFGRKLRMVRDDELAAVSLGKNAARAKLEAMVIGSFLAGIAGAVYALVHLASVNPDHYMPDITFAILAMVLVGGVGNNVGAVIGAALLALVERLGYMAGTWLQFNYGYEWGGYLYYLIYGLAIIAAIFLRPQGLLPETPVKTPAWRVLEEKAYALPRSVKGRLVPMLAAIVRRRKASVAGVAEGEG